uniref:Ankyrin repeat domain-containing protein 6 n=1 Tax=Cacopsylla melanoneura TaxID=428564 RepID=A0A8D9EV41_9HEMI
MVDDKAPQHSHQAQSPADLKRNALHLSAATGSVDAVAKILSSKKFDINATDSMGYTTLQIAATEGHVDVARYLIKQGADINVQDKVHGNTALHEACWRGYSRTVTTIAKSKSNLHVLNNGGFAPLHLCCQNGHNQSCRELLLAGCSPDIKNNYGDTPLHTSARYGHAGVTRILISAECRVSEQNKNGDTALHISAAMGRRKLTRILIEAGCDEQLHNKQQESAKDIAVRKDLKEIIAIFNNAAFLRAEQKRKSAVSFGKTRNSPSRDKNRESRNSNRSKDSRERKKKLKLASSPIENGPNWSPYGCHYSPDPEEFPQPKMGSLPEEPLRKGEQYYLDLAGNIRKGPVGVGYTCYCAPFFRHIEAKIEQTKKELKESLDHAKHSLNKRMADLEERANLRVMDSERSIWLKSPQMNGNESGPVSRSRSLEILIDDIKNCQDKPSQGEAANLLSQRLQSCNIDSKLSPTIRNSVLESIWRSHRSSLQNSTLDMAPKLKMTHRSMHDINLTMSPEERLTRLSEFNKGKESPESGLVSSEPSNTTTHTPDLAQEELRKSVHEMVSKFRNGNLSHSSLMHDLWLEKDAQMSLHRAQFSELGRQEGEGQEGAWRKETGGDLSESSDEEDGERTRRRGPYISMSLENNDSGYSTKICSNSQGPSPSLSVRLETDGLTNGSSPSPYSLPPEDTSKILRLPPTDLTRNASLV